MLAIGFLFGLGFDTATEVALFGISSTQAANGMSFSSIMVFPALFTAGMSLVDTTDGVLMLGAYGWAFMKPIRKLYYNMTITAVSVVVAVVIGGLETLNLIGDQLGLTDGGGFWGTIGGVNDNFGILGYVIIGIFVLSWIGSSCSTNSSATTNLKLRLQHPDMLSVTLGRATSANHSHPNSKVQNAALRRRLRSRRSAGG